ncbi:MAG: CBS domain-containing protein [Bacteroidota bacterium]
MIAADLISDSVPSIKPKDPVGLALEWMNEFKLAQLAIVDKGIFRGLVTEDDLLDSPEEDFPISSLKHVYSGWESVYVNLHDHVYEAIKVMSQYNIEVIAVQDADGRYQGILTIRDIIKQFNNLFALNEPGGILVLEIPQYSYVLSEIGRITESVDAKVLSLYLSNVPESRDMLLTLKLNVEDLERVKAAFERFDYNVVSTFTQIQKGFDPDDWGSILRMFDL